MSASTKRILLLGVAVILIGSSSSYSSLLFQSDAGNLAYAEGIVSTQQAPSAAGESAAYAAINIGHGKTEHGAEAGEVVSAEVKTDRRPLIAVPILVQIGSQGKIVESVGSSGGVRFELDHQVPPPSEGESSSSSGTNVRRADPAFDRYEAPADVLKDGAENQVSNIHPTQDEAPLTNPEEPSDAASSKWKPKPESVHIATLETTSSAPAIAQIEVHAEPTLETKAEALAVFQEPDVQNSLPEIKAESEKANQPSTLAPAIDLTLLDKDPKIHAILDASAKDFGSPQIPPPAYAAIVSIEGTGPNGPHIESKTEEKENKGEATAGQAAAESEVVDGMAKVLFDQYRAKIEAELESYKAKVSPNDGQDVFEIGSSPAEDLVAPPVVDTAPVQPPLPFAADDKSQGEEEEMVVVLTEGKMVKVNKLNKLNKNHDGFDGSQETNSGGDDLDSHPQILIHLHHHHVSGGSRKQPQKQQQQQQQQKQESSDNVIVANDDQGFASPVQETTSVIHQELSQTDDDEGEEDEGAIDETEVESVTRPPPPLSFPPTAVPPESLRNRGLVPSVKGAYHCAPQFCVNVSLSDDGQFATFHIERSMEEIGWISLGIGYAMTTADLLIMWPNKDPASGGGPRGATFSRRTSHAYVEPRLVSREEAEIKASGKGESLYPENEYIIHNPSKDRGGEAAMTAAIQVFPVEYKRFIVQFTRPVRTQNRAHKLTPGKEQDFCWAYSPNPISADSVGDPGAHITQHMSVGSFAMDVGANQPQLKDAILKQQKIDVQEAVIEKERKIWELKESNRRLEEDEKERIKEEKESATTVGGHKVSTKHKAGSSGSNTETSDAASVPWLRIVGYSGGGLSSSMLALQGFSCLVAVAFMWFFR
ncbi:hypothetical protein BGZ96_008920 [Linnemannia gamsii]|uniref:DOMON domain-containing protein n=1 Tax=Linnemannia gamsii TaxID=64522 RepID=A0ABQ7JY00_9FUNG|nr:hypothetical protein BGZ96_008920 [Linnemannia gamsii]